MVVLSFSVIDAVPLPLGTVSYLISEVVLPLLLNCSVSCVTTASLVFLSWATVAASWSATPSATLIIRRLAIPVLLPEPTDTTLVEAIPVR